MSAGGRKNKNNIIKPDVILTFLNEEDSSPSTIVETKTENYHPALSGRRSPLNVHLDAPTQMSGVRHPLRHPAFTNIGYPLTYEEIEYPRRFQGPTSTTPTIYRLPDGEKMSLAPESDPAIPSSHPGQTPILFAIPIPRHGLQTHNILHNVNQNVFQDTRRIGSYQPRIAMSPPNPGYQVSHYSTTSPLLSPPSTTLQPPLFTIPVSGPGLSPTEHLNPPLNRPVMVAEPQHSTNISSQGARQFLNPTPSSLFGLSLSNVHQSKIIDGDLDSNSSPSSLHPQTTSPSSSIKVLNLSKTQMNSSSSKDYSPNSSSDVFQYAFHENGKMDRLSSTYPQSNNRSPTSPYKLSLSSTSEMGLLRSPLSVGSSHDPLSPPSSLISLDSERIPQVQVTDLDKMSAVASDSSMSSKHNQSDFSFVDMLNDEKPLATLEIPLSDNTQMSVQGIHSPVDQRLKSSQSSTSQEVEANNNTLHSPGFGITQMQSQFASMNAPSTLDDDVFAFEEAPPKHDKKSKTRKKYKLTKRRYSDDCKIFKCPTCSREFDQSISLKNHERSHRTDKDHHCRFCKKIFHYKYDLRKHERIHAKELHVCRFCGTALECDYDLVQHEREHRQNNETMMTCYSGLKTKAKVTSTNHEQKK